jgi:hypothetical protein
MAKNKHCSEYNPLDDSVCFETLISANFPTRKVSIEFANQNVDRVPAANKATPDMGIYSHSYICQ